MLTIIFEAHGTTFDNEAHLASGHNDVALSLLGEQQSREMGKRYKNHHFDAIFVSDLQRAYRSAEIGFGNKWPIIKDARLRECNYGDFTQKPSEQVDVQKVENVFEGLDYYNRFRLTQFCAGHIEQSDAKKVVIKPKSLEYAGETLAVR